MAALTNEQRHQKLKELIGDDDKFLEKLAEAGRLSGWTNDYVEVENFIKDCFEAANKPVPDLEPHQIID